MLAAASALLGAPLTPQGGALEALRVLASVTPNEQGKASGPWSYSIVQTGPGSCLPPGCPADRVCTKFGSDGKLAYSNIDGQGPHNLDASGWPSTDQPSGLRVENAGSNQDGAAFDYVVDLAAGSSYTAHNVRRNALYADDNGQSMLQINLKQGSEVRVHRGG